ncbi:Pumilio RNA-binding repeat [Dillenia turbinata]|uniref:Pumilio RNA-binding repeat n=1 Tax=Dillenia turbinata TaxID=194707 RepID=A0AAN8WCZ5_9MAGN
MEKQQQETILPQEYPQNPVLSAQQNVHSNLSLCENIGSQPNPLNLPQESLPFNFPSRLIGSLESLNLSNPNYSVFGGQVLPGSSSNPVLSPFSTITFPRFEMGFNPNPNQSLIQGELDLQAQIICEEEINGGFQYPYYLALAEAEQIQRNLQRLRIESPFSSWNPNLAPVLDSNTYNGLRRTRRSRNQFNVASSSQPMFLNSQLNNLNYLDSSNLNFLNSVPSPIAGLNAALSSLSLDQFKGRLYSLARDQTGSKFLQTKLESGKPEEIDLIFTELKIFVQELVTDQAGNYAMQKLFSVCNEKQMKFLLFELSNARGGLLHICCNSHGSRCMQKFVEHLTSPSLKAMLVKFLKPITCTLIKNTHGRCVIELCLRIFSHEDVKGSSR